MARLRVTDGGMAFDVYLDDKVRVVVGRNDTCDVTLHTSEASREHCEVRLTEEGFVLTDLGSSNGTVVNGRAVRRAVLRSGDTLTIGDSSLAFHDPDEAARLAAAGKSAPAPRPIAVDAAEADAARPPRRVSSRRAAVRRRGPDSTLMLGLALIVGLIAAIVVVVNLRSGATQEADAIIAEAKKHAAGSAWQRAIETLDKLPAAVPSDVKLRADSLRDEWRKRLKNP